VVSGSSAPISALWLLPYPEGTSGAFFCPDPKQLNGVLECQPLSMSTITAALGEPVSWPSPTVSKDCQTGWIMKVILVDRTRLVYGPCEHPSSIVALRDALVEESATS
jgi:hypothetical protein